MRDHKLAPYSVTTSKGLLEAYTVTTQTAEDAPSAEAVMEYYAADYEAERILAQLRSGILPEGVVAEGDVYGYSCPVSETQCLQVSVQKVGEDWKVLRWMVVTEWN